MTPTSAVTNGVTPNSSSSRILETPLSDESIWQRLNVVGFDEGSIKRGDKAALIAYIAKLEAEVYEHQHHTGLLRMGKNEWDSMYDEATSIVDSVELNYNLEWASHVCNIL